jgi:hypothetical protein
VNNEYFSTGDYFKFVEEIDDYIRTTFCFLCSVGKQQVNLVALENGSRFFFNPLTVKDLHKIEKSLIYKNLDTLDRKVNFTKIHKHEAFYTLYIKYE